jgi:hypothetical protein
MSGVKSGLTGGLKSMATRWPVENPVGQNSLPPASPSAASPSAVGGTRRRCVVCGERLSSYNPEPTCFAHTVNVPWKGPNNRP